MKRDCVAKEINCLLVKAKLFIQLSHRHRIQILIFPSRRVLKIDALHVLVEGQTLSLLEHAHQARCDGLLVRSWHFVNIVRGIAKETSFRVLHDIGTVDGLPFEIASHLCMQKHLDKQAIRHDKLGNEVDIPVPVVAVLRGCLSTWTEHLPEVGQV